MFIDGKLFQIIEIGAVQGLVWFPIVLSIGIIFRYLKSIDVSIDGIMVISTIAFVLVFNLTNSLILASICTTTFSVLCYTVVHYLIHNLKINDILTGIIFSLVLHSISVILITESVTLDYENISICGNRPILYVTSVSLLICTEYFFRTALGNKIVASASSLDFNSDLKYGAARLYVYILAGAILSIGAIVYTSETGMARSGGGFEFLITSLSSYLLVDRIMDYFLINTKGKLPFRINRILDSTVFRAAFGSVIFQILVLCIIYYTDNPVYWKLIFGLLLLALVSDYSKIKSIMNKKSRGKKLNTESLQISDLSYSYSTEFNHTPVLADFSCQFEKGLTILWGSNGSGKSTLLNLISGKIKPNGGFIGFKGKDLVTMSVNRPRIFHIPQNPYKSLCVDKSVYENKEASRVSGLLNDLVCINLNKSNDHEMTQSGALSGGQAQFLTYEMCSIYEPDIILADEPTSGADKDHFQSFVSFIEEQKLKGKTIIITTHDERLKPLSGFHLNLDQMKYEKK